MRESRFYPYLQALLAAILFGMSAPLGKLLLGQIDPLPLASLLYLGCGIGLFVFSALQNFFRSEKPSEANISRKDIPWLMGAVIAGGVAAPVTLLFSLEATPAATASLLLNFETVSTALIAFLFFQEKIGKNLMIAIIFVTSASIVLSLNSDGDWGFSLASLGVIAACLFWGMDNNFTNRISGKNPVSIATIKGIGAGSFSFLLASLTQSEFPGALIAAQALLLGFLSYGVSIVLFIFAMRKIGAARTSTLFSTTPFSGAILSFMIFQESPTSVFYVGSALMLIGWVFLLSEASRSEK